MDEDYIPKKEEELKDKMSKEWNGIGGTPKYWELKAELEGIQEAKKEFSNVFIANDLMSLEV